jgi:putative ABC transport system substrate-binding protein
MANRSRRDALTVLVALPAVLPAAIAQPASKVRRVGFLAIGDPKAPEIDEIEQALGKLGWVRGKNITFESRVKHNSNLLPEHAKELVGLNVDVLVTYGSGATQAAMRATSTIPIVFYGVTDPIESGIVSSMSRPNGNATGMAALWNELNQKLFEALRELVPHVHTIAIPIFSDSPASERETKQAPVERRFASMGLRALFFHGPRMDDASAETVIAAVAKQRVDALLLPATFYPNGPALAQAALRHRLPSFGPDSNLVEQGTLLAVGLDWNEQFETLADFINRILRGAKPADLPVRQPTRFDVVVNQKTAKELGIKVPQSLLARARLVS